MLGESVLKALEADVIDFDDPDVPARVQNINHKKQIVLRLGLPDSEDHHNVPSGADDMQRSRRKTMWLI